MIYYCTDPHWGHETVAKLRGLTADSWKAYVLAELTKLDKRDTLYILGDVALDRREFLEFCHIVRSLPTGDVHLVWGNHDPASPAHSHVDWKCYEAAHDTFASCETFRVRRINGRRVLLSHFPYDSVPVHPEAEDTPAHWLYRLHDNGIPLIHGHSHNDVVHTMTHTFNLNYEAQGRFLVPESHIQKTWLDLLPVAECEM